MMGEAWSNLSRGVRITLISLLVFITLLTLFITVFDWNWVKPSIERTVSERTGRDFRIGGRIDVDPGFPMRVRIEQVSFGNPDWAIEREMVRADAVDFTLRFWRLLGGNVTIPMLRLERPFVSLEIGKDAEKQKNWVFKKPDAPPDEEGVTPVLGQVEINDGDIRFHDASKDIHLRTQVASTPALEKDAGLKFVVTGNVREQKVAAEGWTGPLLSIQDQSHPFPVKAAIQVGSTHASLDGTLTGVAEFAAADLQVHLKGDSLSAVHAITGVTFPDTPPFDIRGRLIRDAEYFRFHDFDGRVGDSDLSGNADVAFRDERVSFDADLHSKQLDMDDLAGFVGAPPQTGEGETASEKHEEQAKQFEQAPKLLSEKPIKGEPLRKMDADVRLKASSIRSRKSPIQDVDVHLVLKDGQMTLDPMNLGIADGHIRSNVKLDAREDVLKLDSQFEFERIHLAKLAPKSKMMQDAAGQIGGRATLKGEGTSVAELVGRADGNLGLAMRGGEISNMLLEFAGLDAGEVVELLFKGDENVDIRCGLADFVIEDGIMRSRSTLIDTEDTNIYLNGTVNLRNESLDLRIQPLPKDFSLVSLRAPINVEGTIKDPKIRPDKKMLFKAGLAAVLGALAGPAALIPLIETGPADSADCKGLITAMKEHGRTTPEQQRRVAEASEED